MGSPWGRCPTSGMREAPPSGSGAWVAPAGQALTVTSLIARYIQPVALRGREELARGGPPPALRPHWTPSALDDSLLDARIADALRSWERVSDRLDLTPDPGSRAASPSAQEPSASPEQVHTPTARSRPSPSLSRS